MKIMITMIAMIKIIMIIIKILISDDNNKNKIHLKQVQHKDWDKNLPKYWNFLIAKPSCLEYCIVASCFIYWINFDKTF